MRFRLGYLRSTAVVGLLACWNLAFRQYSRRPGTLPGSPAGLDPAFSILRYFLLGLAVGGMAFCLFSRNLPVGSQKRTWYGIEGTTADFVYLYSLAALAGTLLHTASFR